MNIGQWFQLCSSVNTIFNTDLFSQFIKLWHKQHKQTSLNSLKITFISTWVFSFFQVAVHGPWIRHCAHCACTLMHNAGLLITQRSVILCIELMVVIRLSYLFVEQIKSSNNIEGKIWKLILPFLHLICRITYFAKK